MKLSPRVALLSALLLAACAQPQTTADNTGSAPVGPDTLNVADAAIAGGDPNMALSVSQSVLATDPNNIDALEHEGDAYYALGRCPAASAAYQLALQQNPKATAAETGLGRCLLKTDPAAAEIAFERAVADDPGNADALNDLGIARDLQGNFAGAVDPYRKALLANPALTAAEVNLGLSLALSGNGPAALQYLGPLATSPQATPKIRQDYAAALVATGRDDEARSVLSVDLPPDQVVSAMAGFSALIAQSQSAPPPTPIPATEPVAPVAPVATAAPPPATAPQPLIAAAVAPPPGATPPTPAAPEPPAEAAPPSSPSSARPAPADANAAYTGPSPIPGAVSSSTPGTAPPASAPASIPPEAAPAALPPSVAKALASPITNGASVQLGALNSPDAAERAWRSITASAPALFAGHEPEIEPVSVNGKNFYRLRTSGFATKADAARFCAEVSAAGNACTVANF